MGKSGAAAEVDRGEEPGRALRALVTRPREEAGSLAAALVERGVDTVIEPMMEIHYRAAAMPDLADV